MSHRFYVEPGDIQGGQAVVRGDEHRHLARASRLKADDEVILLDGRGGEIRAVIEKIRRDRTECAVLERCDTHIEAPIRLTVAVAVIKSQRMNWAIQKACELGVAAIWPFHAARSVRTHKGEQSNKVEHWNRVVISAAKQSGRALFPVVRPPLSFETLLTSASGFSPRLLFHQGAEADQWGRVPDRAQASEMIAVFGPEGGFTDGEFAAAREAGFEVVGLGPRTLRAETAVVAGAAILLHRLGDIK